jgi:hypothetical protein
MTSDVRRTPGICHGCTGRDVNSSQTFGHVGEHSTLTTMEMGGARHIDHQSIGRIRSHNWGITPKSPEREPVQRCKISLRFCILDDEVGYQRLRFGYWHADMQASLPRGMVRCHHDALVALPPDEDKRRLRPQ